MSKVSRRLPAKGRGLFRAEFYSFCSRHMRGYDPFCGPCQRGMFHNVWLKPFDNAFFKFTPRLWRWWNNRPSGRTARAMLRQFPHLKIVDKDDRFPQVKIEDKDDR